MWGHRWCHLPHLFHCRSIKIHVSLLCITRRSLRWKIRSTLHTRLEGKKTQKSNARPCTRLRSITVCQYPRTEGLSHPDYSLASGSLFKKRTGGCNLSLLHKCPNRHVLRSLSHNCWINKEQQIEGEVRKATAPHTHPHARTPPRRFTGTFLSHIRARDGWRVGEEERQLLCLHGPGVGR